MRKQKNQLKKQAAALVKCALHFPLSVKHSRAVSYTHLEIEQTGIRPFAACTKYMEQVVWLSLGFSYDEIFSDMEKQLHYNEFVQKQASCENLLEPAFLVLKDFYEKGLLSSDDFSASITPVSYTHLLLSLQKRIAIASSRWNSAGSNVSIAAIPPSELAVWFSTPGW